MSKEIRLPLTQKDIETFKPQISKEDEENVR